ncbi:class I tRNA ligase family protein [Streptomyces thinghirensis]|nr:class I tRNA ligase family protein [Streptomyces thinghirensis]
MSNWYVRRSRRRFWQGDKAALRTLHEVVETVTKLMAPLTPFITERVWQDLVVPVTLAPPSRCTSPRGRRLTCRRSTRSCRSRWCWSAAWSNWAVPHARSRASRPASRSAAR